MYPDIPLVRGSGEIVCSEVDLVGRIFSPVRLEGDCRVNFGGAFLVGEDSNPALTISSGRAFIANVTLSYPSVLQLCNDNIVIEVGSSICADNVTYSGYLLDKRILPMRECILPYISLGDITSAYFKASFQFFCPYEIQKSYSDGTVVLELKRNADYLYHVDLLINTHLLEDEFLDHLVFEFSGFKKKVPVTGSVKSKDRKQTTREIELPNSPYYIAIKELDSKRLPLLIGGSVRDDLIARLDNKLILTERSMRSSVRKSIQKSSSNSIRNDLFLQNSIGESRESKSIYPAVDGVFTGGELPTIKRRCKNWFNKYILNNYR